MTRPAPPPTITRPATASRPHSHQAASRQGRSLAQFPDRRQRDHYTPRPARPHRRSDCRQVNIPPHRTARLNGGCSAGPPSRRESACQGQPARPPSQAPSGRLAAPGTQSGKGGQALCRPLGRKLPSVRPRATLAALPATLPPLRRAGVGVPRSRPGYAGQAPGHRPRRARRPAHRPIATPRIRRIFLPGPGPPAQHAAADAAVYPLPVLSSQLLSHPLPARTWLFPLQLHAPTPKAVGGHSRSSQRPRPLWPARHPNAWHQKIFQTFPVS